MTSNRPSIAVAEIFVGCTLGMLLANACLTCSVPDTSAETESETDRDVIKKKIEKYFILHTAN
ncbi:MAG: hypothetical protein OQK44_04270 [Gammaproteobacteria bacterium]|nr:hypothetical protein [Gammaproteobacteria bacterium]